MICWISCPRLWRLGSLWKVCCNRPAPDTPCLDSNHYGGPTEHSLINRTNDLLPRNLWKSTLGKFMVGNTTHFSTTLFGIRSSSFSMTNIERLIIFWGSRSQNTEPLSGKTGVFANVQPTQPQPLRVPNIRAPHHHRVTQGGGIRHKAGTAGVPPNPRSLPSRPGQLVCLGHMPGKCPTNA